MLNSSEPNNAMNEELRQVPTLYLAYLVTVHGQNNRKLLLIELRLENGT